MTIDIAAIDFTSSNLNICTGNVNKAGQVQSKVNYTVECNGIKKGIVQDIDTVSDVLYNSLKYIKTEHGIGIKSAYISVPGYKCIVNHNSVRENVYKQTVDEECLQSIKNKLLSVNKTDNYVVADIAVTKFLLDNNMEVRDPFGKNANTLSASANVISISKDYLSILVKLFENVGLNMDGIIMNTLSGLSMLPTSDSERSNIIIINISWEITDITVCRCGKIIYTDTIHAGAKNIIKDVSIGLNINFEEAENMLNNYPIADTQYIKNDFETTVKTSENETITFLLSDMIMFVKDRIYDIYEICMDKLFKQGINFNDCYNVCVYGSDIERYTGYNDLAQETFKTGIKKIPYAFFEVEDIRFGTCAGIIRYISHHPLLKKESEIVFKNTGRENKKDIIFKKFLRFMKID